MQLQDDSPDTIDPYCRSWGGGAWHMALPRFRAKDENPSQVWPAVKEALKSSII